MAATTTTAATTLMATSIVANHASGDVEIYDQNYKLIEFPKPGSILYDKAEKAHCVVKEVNKTSQTMTVIYLQNSNPDRLPFRLDLDLGVKFGEECDVFVYNTDYWLNGHWFEFIC